MGAACSSGVGALIPGSAAYPVKVLILGKQGAGKTFLLYSWRYGVDSIVSVEPTSHFNVDTVTSSSGKKFLVYDLAGDIGMRLRPFLEGSNGVVYMLGTYGDDFLGDDEMDTLQQLLLERDLEHAPFLFVVRKEGQESHHDLPQKLQDMLEGRPWDMVDMRPYSQEDTDLVLRILEKLFVRSHTIG